MSKQEAVLRTNYWSGVSRKGKQKRWQDRENLQWRIWLCGLGDWRAPTQFSQKNHPGAHQEEKQTALVQL